MSGADRLLDAPAGLGPAGDVRSGRLSRPKSSSEVDCVLSGTSSGQAIPVAQVVVAFDQILVAVNRLGDAPRTSIREFGAGNRFASFSY
jgi:hypothetical protein